MGKTKAMATDEILTLSQAAAFQQVEESALRAEAEAGRVPARRIAGDYRFSRRAILRWIRTGRADENIVIDLHDPPSVSNSAFFTESDLREPTLPQRMLKSMTAQQSQPHLIPEETPEEFEAFLEILRKQRDESDRATKSGRYAEE